MLTDVKAVKAKLLSVDGLGDHVPDHLTRTL
jgi:hypothetical protein